MGRLEAFFAGLAGKLALAVLLVALIVFGVSQCQNARNSAAGARLSESQAGAVSDSGKDAVNAVGALNRQNEATDEITRENADAIHAAPGADAPVDPRARDAGLRALCRRRAYSGRPECVRFAPAGGLAPAGAGGAAAGG